jgi:uncharacterized protein (UPF0276 family)
VSDAVWRLYAYTVERLGERTTMVEWDADIPILGRLVDELAHAQEIASNGPMTDEETNVAVAR